MSDLPERTRPNLLSTLGGLSLPVTRSTYLSVGAGLMLLKFAVEAAVIYGFSGQLINPLIYLMPVASLRIEMMGLAPDWVLIAIVAWTLPFAWIGASMSVRRARDAGLHPAVGLLFFVPLLNYLLMLGLAALPSNDPRYHVGTLDGADRGVAAALTGMAGGLVIAGGMVGLSVTVLGSYSAGLFVGTPFVMGAVAGLLYNLRRQQTGMSTALVGVTTAATGMGLMMLFALEGLLCLAMASPLLLGLGLVGALVGRELARAEARRALSAPLIALPLITMLTPEVQPLVHEVTTTVEVDAPPEVVWESVVAFPDIPEEVLPEWYFRLGMAWPKRARIVGEGVGAIRYCEFSTGAFVEPITAWEPPNRLAFDVSENPPSMTEFSPWGDISAPHLDNPVLKSRRGQFLLEPLPGGRTRLTGTTWYTVDMAPDFYWAAFSSHIIHRIHERVLNHVGNVSTSRAQ